MVGPVMSSLSSTDWSYDEDSLASLDDGRWLTIAPALLSADGTEAASSIPRHPQRTDDPLGGRDSDGEEPWATASLSARCSEDEPSTAEVDSAGNVGRQFPLLGGLRSHPLEQPQPTNGDYSTKQASSVGFMYCFWCPEGTGGRSSDQRSTFDSC